MRTVRVFQSFCDEDEKRFVLNDTVICDWCGCEVWYEDAHEPWPHGSEFGWVKKCGPIHFKICHYAHYTPSRKRYNRSKCSFCKEQDIINSDRGRRRKRDGERQQLLVWLGLQNDYYKMNKDELNELINLKRIEIQTKRELKKLKK